MKRSAAWTAWLLVCVAMHATLPSLRGQQENLRLKQGTHLFRQLLYQAAIKPLKSLQDLAGDEDQKLLILLGETKFLDDTDFHLADWVSKGGAVLIATDRDANGSSLKPFATELVGDRVEISVDDPACYKNSKDCMVVRSTRAGEPVFKELKRVATNISGYALLPGGPRLPGGLHVFAEFPPGPTSSLDPAVRTGGWPSPSVANGKEGASSSLQITAFSSIACCSRRTMITSHLPAIASSG